MRALFTSDGLAPSKTAARIPLAAVTTLLLALCLSLWSWRVSHAQYQREANARFDTQRDDIVEAIDNRMLAYRQVLKGAQGLFAASHRVAPNEFRAYLDHLKISDYYPGIQGIGYTRMIEAPRRARRIQRVAGKASGEYAATPEGEPARYAAVVYLEPLKWRNRRAFGQNLFSDPAGRAALEKARDTGLPTMSGKVSLARDSSLMYLPTYRKGAPLSSAAERRQALSGYLFSALQVHDLMRDVQGKDSSLVHLRLYDGEATTAENLMYDSHPDDSSLPALPAGIRRTETLDLNGRAWRLVLTSTPAFDAVTADQEKPLYVLLAGCLISLMLSGVTWLIVRSWRRAHALSAAMTAELRAAKEVAESTSMKLAGMNLALQRQTYERAQAEEGLRESEERLRLALSATKLGIWSCDLAAERLYLDGRARSHFAVDGEVLFSQLIERVHPHDRQQLEQAIRGAHEPTSDGRYAHVYRYLDTDGGTRWLHAEAQVHFEGEAANRTAVRMIGTIQDITARKQAEHELRETHQRFQSAFEHAAIGMALIGVDGRWLRVNDAICRLVGYTQEELLATTSIAITHPDDLDADRTLADKLLAGEIDHHHMEKRYLHRAGHVVSVLLSVSLVRDAQQQPRYLVSQSQDITARKAAEEQFREHAKRLELKNRELQDFAHVASHDLQEPLRKIQAFGDLVASTEGERLSENGRDYVSRMQNAAARMRSLIEDLLALSRVASQARPFVKVDLSQVTREVLTDLETRLEQTGASVEVGELPEVEADPTQMRQLLQNLIGNALKFQRPGEKPRIKVCARHALGYLSGVGHAERRGGSWQVCVEDNGIGFDIKYLDRIFSPFQRLHGRGAFEGNGIGLAICQNIIARHGGEITAQSRPGGGAVFIFTLPCAQAAASRPADDSDVLDQRIAV